MNQCISLMTIVVRDYDEAVEFYVDALGFHLIEDTALPGEGKRWVVVAPPGATESRLLLAKAKNAAELARIGNQTGGRVFLFLQTDDFWRDYYAYKERGVQFPGEPREEEYGTVAVFVDVCGNRWDLIEPTAPPAEE